MGSGPPSGSSPSGTSSGSLSASRKRLRRRGPPGPLGERRAGVVLEGGGGSTDVPSSDDAAGEQRPEHEQRLEEQARDAFAVGVEPERVGVLEQLRDVAGEDRDEERGDD
jgi:hypothetical protein